MKLCPHGSSLRFIETQPIAVSILHRLDRLHDNIRCIHGGEGFQLFSAGHNNRSNVQLVCRLYDCFCAKAAVMRKQGISAFMNSFIASVVRTAAAFVQRQPDTPIFHADAIFAIVQNCNAVSRFRKVCIFMIGNLELRLFPGRVAVSCTLDIPKLNFVFRKTALNRSVKRCL